MNKWEDIIKGKLEGYESILPEGSLADFHARRNAAISDSGRKRVPIMWVFASVVAVIAAIIFLRHPVVSDDAVQIIEQPYAPVVDAYDSTEVSESAQATDLLAQAIVPKPIDRLPHKDREIVDTHIDEPEDHIQEDDNYNDGGTDKVDSPQDVTEPDNDSLSTPASPFIPHAPDSKSFGIKVGPAAGIVGGSGLLIGLVACNNLLYIRDHNYERIDDRDVCMVEDHYLPFKFGLSARVPISQGLNITTGLEYSQYTSKLVYSLSGDKIQQVYYLSLPVRLDWTIASNNWLDVYVGGGLEGSYCIAATQNGVSIPKDGFGFTVLGAAGIQWKFTKNLGLYFEPEISWTNPSFTNPLRTYRTKHPVAFSLTSGFRYTFGK